MGESHSGNSGSVVSTSTTTSKVDSSHTNHNEFGNQQVSIGGSTGAGTSIAFSNLATLDSSSVILGRNILGANSATWTPENLPQN